MSSINDFISSIENENRKLDAKELLSIMESVSGYKPHLSGSIIGFGKYDYKYESGREGTSAVVAFSPRKQNLVLYIMPGFENNQDLLESLGKHRTGKSCLYINKLNDIDLVILKKIIKASVEVMKEKHDCRNA